MKKLNAKQKDRIKILEKSLVCLLYRQAKQMNKKELQEVLFWEEDTTNSWDLKQCQTQYVKDQFGWINDNHIHWKHECDEAWNNVKEIK